VKETIRFVEQMSAIEYGSLSEPALEMAEKLGAPLTVLHVVHDLGDAPGYYSVKGRKKQLRRMEDVAADMLSEFTLKMIEQEKGTVFFNFAPILKMLLDQLEKTPFDISTVRNVGGLDHRENIERFLQAAPNATFWAGFGQTEAMGVTRSPFNERPGSAGKPSTVAQVALFDDYDQPVPVGTPGEICVRSPGVFLGYWGRDEDNAYTFRNGWHHTGDIGRFDEDGYLWYVKRKAEKELIKPGGENVYPAEVEKAILEHEAVVEASVIGVSDTQWGEAIKAVCVLATGKYNAQTVAGISTGTKIDTEHAGMITTGDHIAHG